MVRIGGALRTRATEHPVLGVSGAVLLLLTGALAAGRNTLLVPRETSDAHHVFEEACSACHVPFEGVATGRCMECHREDLAEDTHPARAFDDPRWMETMALLDVRRCETCHREHRRTPRGVTARADLCVGCHDDVFRTRPTHADVAADSCAAPGCHNYHDNSRLNASGLEARLTGAPALPPRVVPATGSSDPSVEGPEDVIAASAGIVALWRRSAHAREEVGCPACHAHPAGAAFAVKVADAACARCHEHEARTFAGGKHGVRARLGLPALSPRRARLELDTTARATLGCSTCHDPHSVDTREAAVDACLRCHADDHSRAFRAGPHGKTFDPFAAGPPGDDEVTCATCHLPRVATNAADGTPVSRVTHDNSALSAPRDAMADLCIRCHPFERAFTALLDDSLVLRNFPGWNEELPRTLEMLKEGR